MGLEQAWNDFHNAFKESIPDEEEGLAALFAWAVKQCSEEMPSGYFFGTEARDRVVPIEVHGPDNTVDCLLAAVCEKRTQGGGLGRQITEVEKIAGETPVVLLRSTAFSKDRATDVSKQVAAILKRGGRRLVVENADWRTMQAFRQFQSARGQQSGFAEWLRDSRPLSQLASLRHALALDNLLLQPPSVNKPPETESTGARDKPPAPTKPEPPVAPPVPEQEKVAAGPLLLGTRAGLTAGPVTIDPKELTQHAAFLGAPGSGKTTAALNLIEQLLERGIPTILLDRKGDLCRYADPSAWNAPLADPVQATRRRRLRQQLDIAVYTPGQPEGRPLSIPIVPEDMDQLTTFEREQLAGYAAAALGGMMGYRPKGTDQKCQAILSKAIEVLAAAPTADMTVPGLRQLIEDRDDSLLTAVGGFDDKLYKKLGDDLLALWLRHKSLLSGEAEPLDIDALLGRNPEAKPGKTRLSIISTRFLNDAATTDFWMAQFLMAVGRWIGKRPADRLQAVFLFDEADQYLPAQRQPATKAPMENLLKRARSAGVGLMLATQSPGDFDYKCRDTIRTWLVGRVKEQTALNKLRPMLSECKVDITAKLPGQGTGQFHLIREKDVSALQTRPSLVNTEQLSEERIMELARASRS